MEIDPYPASVNVLTDENSPNSSIKKDGQDISQPLATNASVS